MAFLYGGLAFSSSLVSPTHVPNVAGPATAVQVPLIHTRDTYVPIITMVSSGLAPSDQEAPVVSEPQTRTSGIAQVSSNQISIDSPTHEQQAMANQIAQVDADEDQHDLLELQNTFFKSHSL
jgi:hypothetical protein